MFLNVAWYWWVLIVVIVVISIPVKIKIWKWWNIRQKENDVNKKDKWGGEE